MDLNSILIPTRMACPGMTLGDALAECVARDVPGIPYRDGDGRIAGRFSVRHALAQACLPLDLVEGVHLLGDDIQHMDLSGALAETVLQLPVEDVLLDDVLRLSPASPPLKALAMMEKYRTTHLFVVDGESYRGVVTDLAVAALLLKGR
jgi:hypothetical protein